MKWESITWMVCVCTFLAYLTSCSFIEANKSIECVKNGGTWRYSACRSITYKGPLDETTKP